MVSGNLLQIREYLKLTQNEFALKLGITTRSYINYERGERKLPFELLEKLCNDYNVNLNWLIAGKGEMFIPPKFEDAKEEVLSQVNALLEKYGFK